MVMEFVFFVVAYDWLDAMKKRCSKKTNLFDIRIRNLGSEMDKHWRNTLQKK